MPKFISALLVNVLGTLLSVHLILGKTIEDTESDVGVQAPLPHIPITFFKFDAPSGMYQFGTGSDVVSVLPHFVFSFRFVGENTHPYYVRYSDGMYDLALDCNMGSPFFRCPWLKEDAADGDESLNTAFAESYR